VSVGLNSGSGTAYFDGVQLEKGTVLHGLLFTILIDGIQNDPLSLLGAVFTKG
jgi:hypothetical protein